MIRKNTALVLAGTILLGALLIFGFLLRTTNDSVHRNALQQAKANVEFSQAAERLINSAAPVVWKIPNQPNKEDEFLQSQEYRIIKAFERNGSLPLVQSFKSLFGNNVAVAVINAPNEVRYITGDKRAILKIGFYPEAARASGNIPNLAATRMYDDANFIILLPGFDQPDTNWYDARLFHESYHYRQRLLKVSVVKANSNLDYSLEEELQAHDLATDILNLGTHGKYLDTIDSIVKQKHARHTSPVQADYL